MEEFHEKLNRVIEGGYADQAEIHHISIMHPNWAGVTPILGWQENVRIRINRRYIVAMIETRFSFLLTFLCFVIT